MSLHRRHERASPAKHEVVSTSTKHCPKSQQNKRERDRKNAYKAAQQNYVLVTSQAFVERKENRAIATTEPQ
jgi:hypothetical protein